MSKHTPGPWEADNNEGFSIWSVRADGNLVARIVWAASR